MKLSKDLNMKAENFTKQELFEMLLLLNEKLNKMQATAKDNQTLLVELVKQNNNLFKFIHNLEIEEVLEQPQEDYFYPGESLQYNDHSTKSLYELVKSLMDKKEELKEFEEELKKHKDKLTPGQIGES